MMRLYGYWRSSSAWRVRLALALKKAPHEQVAVNLGPGVHEHEKAEFRSKNPQQQVPVLELDSGQRDSGQCLRQSMAILEYLESAFPEPALFPSEPTERAFAMEAAELVNSGIQPLQNSGVLLDLERRGADSKAFARHFMHKGLGTLEALANERGGNYSVGDSLTVADVYLIPQLYNARRFELPLEGYPKLLAIEARCAALEAFQRAHPDAQPDKPASIAAVEAEPRLTGLYGVHYYVHDLERSRRFYVSAMDLAEIGGSGEELEQRGKQRSAIFAAGDCTIVCSTPLGEGGRAARYLAKHPDGVGTVVFECQNLPGWFQRLERAGATPIADIEQQRDEGGTLSTFSITTPFGDTTFRFFERQGYRGIFPGMHRFEQPRGGNNAFGFEHIDHITSNFQTMAPAILWLERVLGFERFWDIEFHTQDVATQRFDDGSGLRSIVMRDPLTGIKFANNEPYRPFFKHSQINLFNEDHRGDGVQHIALSTPDILQTVRGLRERGVEFMPTPKSYYEALPRRLGDLGIGQIDESIEQLAELGILLDGAGKGRYLLQIFLKDSAGLYQDRGAGPFFFELIQRKGDRGFGAGNFRALFESIEREQTTGRSG
jgi:4-hydroxyphenylpyruvate dioxygenase